MSTEEGVKRKGKVSTLLMVGFIFEFSLLEGGGGGGGGGQLIAGKLVCEQQLLGRSSSLIFWPLRLLLVTSWAAEGV